MGVAATAEALPGTVAALTVTDVVRRGTDAVLTVGAPLAIAKTEGGTGNEAGETGRGRLAPAAVESRLSLSRRKRRRKKPMAVRPRVSHSASKSC